MLTCQQLQIRTDGFDPAHSLPVLPAATEFVPLAERTKCKQIDYFGGPVLKAWSDHEEEGAAGEVARPTALLKSGASEESVLS